VSIYSEFVFPRLCDFLLNSPFVANQRRTALASAYGDILEIGFGTGLNLAHYPANVRRLTTVDPNAGMHRVAKKRVRHSRMEVDQRICSGDRLSFEDSRFDCAVSTFTLCSIEDVSRALSEVYRVLKPGGRLLLLEHGLSPEPTVRKWQLRLNWLEMRLGDGCHLDRNMRVLIGACPYTAIEIDEFYLENTPRTHGYMYRGIAIK
jgi:SAM-dependent methyltransferase